MVSAAIQLNDRFWLRLRRCARYGLLVPLTVTAMAATMFTPSPTRSHARLDQVAALAASDMSPYDGAVNPSVFVQAAAIELRADRDSAQSVTNVLQAMRGYHVNTVSIYGLEDWDSVGSSARKDSLFATLGNFDMRAVVRLEAYDGARFAFGATDVDYVVNRYLPLIRYVADPARNSRVSYVAINMPVDDPAVQQRLGGVNSALSRARQQEYARTIVARLRTLLGQLGFGGAQLRLGVFYGWDGGYDLPSYASAQSDGYFVTNYSYPTGAALDESATDHLLINTAGLQRIMSRFTGQYGAARFVVEYGLHTVEYNGWVSPGQTAGLVRTLAAKQRALKATTRYYRTFGGLVGTSYFGFNLIKHEGNATDLIDWTLQYP